MTRIIIAGAKGRMGQALLRCAAGNAGLTVTGQIDLGQDLRGCIADADVVIDFTSHVGSSRVDLQACKLEYSIVSPK